MLKHSAHLQWDHLREVTLVNRFRDGRQYRDVYCTRRGAGSTPHRQATTIFSLRIDPRRQPPGAKFFDHAFQVNEARDLKYGVISSAPHEHQNTENEAMNKPEDSTSEKDTKKRPADRSPIPSRPEDTDARGDALNGTGEDNHRQK